MVNMCQGEKDTYSMLYIYIYLKRHDSISASNYAWRGRAETAVLLICETSHWQILRLS